jgi:hypothetical protein
MAYINCEGIMSSLVCRLVIHSGYLCRIQSLRKDVLTVNDVLCSYNENPALGKLAYRKLRNLSVTKCTSLWVLSPEGQCTWKLASGAYLPLALRFRNLRKWIHRCTENWFDNKYMLWRLKLRQGRRFNLLIFQLSAFTVNLSPSDDIGYVIGRTPSEWLLTVNCLFTLRFRSWKIWISTYP